MSSLRSWTWRSIGCLGLVACFAGSVLGAGPVGAIVGTVLGESDGNEPIPVPGAAVWLFQEERSGQEFFAETGTNDKGFYAFESLPRGQYLLVVSADGFFPAAAEAGVRPESEVHRDFLLVQVSSPAIGACCLGEPNGEPFCAMLSHDECAAEGGDYFGDDSTCDDPDLPCHNAPPPGEGACCLTSNDGEQFCLMLTGEHCEAEGGDYQGDDSSCKNTDCPPPPLGKGACCLTNDDGQPFCLILTGKHCEAEGGEYQGNGTECHDDSCLDHPVEGACCLNDGCHILTGESCELEGGEFLGGGTECTDHPCNDKPLEGACCLPGGCHILTGELCELEGGEFLGGGTECTDHACTDQPLDGACCLTNDDGTQFCLMLTGEHCDAEGGDYQGDDSSCKNTECLPPPHIGACCLGEPNGEPFCAMLSHDDCAAEGGDYFGDGSTCDDPDVPCHNPPPPEEGACCLTNHDGMPFCLMLTGEHCQAEDGDYQGDGSSCDDPRNPC